MITDVLIEKCSATTNAQLAKQMLEEVISVGVTEFCFCPGARNAPLLYPLVHSSEIHLYSWPEERSAAFFALGRIKATGRPVAVVTTSGTAAAELLPAAIEAYYTGLPLVLITADRPSRFRGSGAPQSIEQTNLFGVYVEEMHDLQPGEKCHLSHWNQKGPLHLNICFEEPNDSECQKIRLDTCIEPQRSVTSSSAFHLDSGYISFLEGWRFPLVVVGELPLALKEKAVRYLLHLNAPLYAEGISGLREDPRLEHLRINRIERVWSFSSEQEYPLDGILRIGGVPTARFWRDLEDKEGQIPVFSVSERPFSGLSHTGLFHTDLSLFFDWAGTMHSGGDYPYKKWKEADNSATQSLLRLFQEEPFAEPSLIHSLSDKFPAGSKVYLGNSLPIREWDLAAVNRPHGFKMACNRGANGIDGQLATFLGYCTREQDNWAILGDLTLLYDLVAPWIFSQLADISANLVVVNNGGAGIFDRMFDHPAFQNGHNLSFETFAKFWGWRYERWERVPEVLLPSKGGRLIELIPDSQATERFLDRMKII